MFGNCIKGENGISVSVLPWITLAAVIWIQSIGSTNTDFAAYSSELKSRLNVNQLKLNNLAVASDAGKLFGWISGFAAARLPLWSVLAIGSALGAFGYGVQFLFLIRKISSLSYAEFFLLNLLNGNSVCWLNTVCYVSVMRQFSPADHGAILGLTTSYSALTAKVYLALAHLAFGRRADGSGFLLLNAATPAVLGFAAMPTLARIGPRPDDVWLGMAAVFVIAGATGAYGIVQTTVAAMRDAPGMGPAAVLLVMVAAVVLVPVVTFGWRVIGRRSEEPKRVAKVGDVADIEEGKMEEREEDVAAAVREGSVKGVWDLLRRVNFWVYFMVYLFGSTLGLVYANNLGQIAQSRGVSQSVLLSISSSFGFFGKLSTAPISAFFRVSTTATTAALMVATAGAFFLLLSPSDGALFVGTAVIGFSTGAMISTAVSLTVELFGQENFGVNHNIVIANVPIGSFLFGSISALFYGHNARPRGGGVCVGVDCYRITFALWGCFCCLGAFLSIVLHYRTRNDHPRLDKLSRFFRKFTLSVS